MTDLRIVEMPSKNLADIPAMLRHTADEIEKGTWGSVHMCIVVIPDGADWPHILEFGVDTNSVEAAFLLMRAGTALIVPGERGGK